jgi:hypothetical protein
VSEIRQRDFGGGEVALEVWVIATTDDANGSSDVRGAMLNADQVAEARRISPIS